MKIHDFTERLSVEDVDAGAADEAARQLLNVWRNCKGYLGEGLQPFATRILIMEGLPCHDTPNVLFAGNDALAIQRLGHAWAENLPRARSKFTPEYRERGRQSYWDAATSQQCIFDIVSTTSTLPEREGFVDIYHRLLLPFATLQGAAFTVCYSFDTQYSLGQYRADNGKSSQSPELGTLPSKGLGIPAYGAGDPTTFHLDN